MVNLRRPTKYTRNSGFSTKYFSLLLAATMALILWGYQKIYYQKASLLLLLLAIIMAALAFGLAIYHIVTIWRKSKKSD
jgi:hypothetical protein